MSFVFSLFPLSPLPIGRGRCGCGGAAVGGESRAPEILDKPVFPLNSLLIEGVGEDMVRRLEGMLGTVRQVQE